MATVKVTALTETTSPQAADVLLISQSGVSKKVQITNLPAATPGTGSISTAMLADDAVTAALAAQLIQKLQLTQLRPVTLRIVVMLLEQLLLL